ncbi:hypothetical protein L210DRAFT_3628802 [Boletus edulis BED1]|uniref:F-box domain-containing protein n=1 Tax=Boletus edulis BED1 TaxID=1328754 RepID=A0AAD4GIQ4_BOLED|nr:hypothetical protein L210DRAFT_3628802 [Boletus edulis BED1]
MSASSVGFWSVPTEIAEQALVLCHPRDIASFAQTCRAAWSLTNDAADQYLWRQLFLLFPFDDPRETRQGFREDIQFDWRTELQRRVRAELIARSGQSTPEDLHAALVTLLDVARSAPPVIQGREFVPSFGLLWVTDVLASTNMLQAPYFTQRPTYQKLARLRSYLALTLDKYDDEEGKSRMKSIRTRSRCRVYDLSQYNRDNDWGPFMRKTGEVDWSHIECIVNVITCNLMDHTRHFGDTRPPCSLEATRAYSAPHATALALHDWAGVEGNWRRIVSFMDYRDLFAFNFSTRGHVDIAQGSSIFEDPQFSEATRLIELKLHLTSPDAVPKYYTLDRFPQSEDTKYPTLYFSGSSHGIQGREATIVGSVYMGNDGVVRWRFVSAREARMQWSSEGVQIGGIASAMGVVGAWAGAHRERGDPAGPFWLWKVPDDHPTSVRALIPIT